MAKSRFKITILLLAYMFAGATFAADLDQLTKYTIDSTGNVGFRPAIAVDGNGFVHISYYDKTNQQIKYATNRTTNAAWKTEVISIDSTDDGVYTVEKQSCTDIVVDSNGKVHIAYFRSEGAWSCYLKYATNSSGRWETESITSDKIGRSELGVALAMDSKGSLHIVYKDDSGILFSKKNSNGWSLLHRLSTRDSSIGPFALSFDSNNNAHIIYSYENALHNDYETWYATNQGGPWEEEKIRSVESRGVSIVVDSQNRPHYAIGDGWTDDINYGGKNDSGFFFKKTIASSQKPGYLISGRYHAQPSIAINSSGKCYVVYHSLSKDVGLYTGYGEYCFLGIRTGSFGSWSGANFSYDSKNCKFPVIAIDESDGVHIAYYDNVKSDLIYLSIQSPEEAEKGSLKVTISPQGAIDAGAQWQVDGGEWYDSGRTISDLSIGNHTIAFRSITGWIPPKAQQVDIVKNQIKPLTASYSVIATAKPNLTTYKPKDWSDEIVISNKTGSQTDSGIIYDDENIYIDWAVINDGQADITTQFYIDLYLDNIKIKSWYSDNLKQGYYANILDYNIGKLSAGNHTITIIADSTQKISESNESDNQFSKSKSIALRAVTGSLKVTLSPQEAINAGAKWQVVEGQWYANGYTKTGILVGNYTVTFDEIPGWRTPQTQQAQILENKTTYLTGNYTLNEDEQDVDKDGINDEWEIDNYGDISRNESDYGNLDTDGDGVSDFEEYHNGTDINEPDNFIDTHLVLINDVLYTLESGTHSEVYGSAATNNIFIKRGAKVDCLSFTGKNTISLESASSVFSAYRLGSVVTFQGTDGTRLLLPATTTPQTLIFANGAEDLVIDRNVVKLGSQEIHSQPEVLNIVLKNPPQIEQNPSSDLENPDAYLLLNTGAPFTLNQGSSTAIYGSTGNNTLFLESAAAAHLFSFPDENTIVINEGSNQFDVYRTGATVIFEGKDATKLVLPATAIPQHIKFNDRSLDLVISNGRILLGDQTIGADPTTIEKRGSHF